MKLFGFEISRQQKPTVSKPGFSRRTFQAAMVNRLTADWTASNKTMNAELKTSLRLMRSRSRDLERNNSYAKKFLNMIPGGVVGPQGIQLQVRASEDNGKTVDFADSQYIENQFKSWSRVGVCTVDGKASFVDAQRLFMKSVARDGEVLVRLIIGADAGNRFGFALQFLEADHLDEFHCRNLGKGRQIYMGVETNKWGRVVAYHLLAQHPGTDTYTWNNKKYIRVPAHQIIHGFIVDRPGQTRGVPWMHAGMNTLHMHGAYQEAELVAARVAAAKMGFIVSPDGDAFDGEEAEDGSLLIEAEAGIFEQLPKGTDFRSWDPQHPNAGYGAFTKDMLRSFAAGGQVTYNGLGNDLEGVNYSSLRQGSLDERDHWRGLQSWMIEIFMQPIYENWLKLSMAAGALDLPPRKFDKFNAANWQPRGWQWVDPKKEVEANVAAINAGLKSRTDVMAEQGRDFNDTVQKLKAEQEALVQAGINIVDPQPMAVPTQDGVGDNGSQNNNNTQDA